MKLQVGSSEVVGRYRGKDWLNLDIEHHSGVNIVADASERIPLDDNTIEEIHCIHVLEHVTRDKYVPMLKEMYRVLKPGGVLYVETPDFRGTINNLQGALITGNLIEIHKWTTSVYGKNERPGMAHYWGFYEELLQRAMEVNGFKDVTQITEVEDMISGHYKQEPVLLMRGTK
jgi:predicted SAM-dependent methyltransferase